VKQLKAEVLKSTFEHLRRCGAGRQECIAYLTGPLDATDLIDGVVHPNHSASPAGYDIDSGEIALMWRGLLGEERSIRMQVHTHPGRAYHSSRDDALALVTSTGALSLVIPDFALGPVGTDDAFLARRDGSGEWVEVAIEQHFEVIE
jgi:proteasome lid subunit RPN8/RPN11